MEYKEYLKTPHWLLLRQKFIYANPKAKCWIDEKTYTLLPHHVQYKNLGREKRFFIFLFFPIGDIAVVCFDCHTNIHFVNIGFPKLHVTIKLPLKRFWLVKRMALLRSTYLIQKKRYGLALWYALVCIIAS